MQPAKPFFVNPRFRFQSKYSGSHLSQHEGVSTFEVGETSKTGASEGLTKHLLNVQRGQENNSKIASKGLPSKKPKRKNHRKQQCFDICYGTPLGSPIQLEG